MNVKKIWQLSNKDDAGQLNLAHIQVYNYIKILGILLLRTYIFFSSLVSTQQSKKTY